MKKLWLLLWMIVMGFGLSSCAIGRGTIRMAKAPNDIVAGKLRSAIWGDLQHELMINWGGWSDLLRGSDDDEELMLRIDDIRCQSSKLRQLCAFDLVRENELKRASDKDVPKALHCTARFIYLDEEWTVRRLPPHKGGHSRTTMRCSTI